MSIQEVGQGGPGGPDYVVLQMYASGQNFVGGKMIQTYTPAGTVQDTFTFPSDVAQGRHPADRLCGAGRWHSARDA